MAQNLHILVNGETDMNKRVMLIADEPTFVFMMTTIVDQFELELLTVKNKKNIWDEIKNRKPAIVIWDFNETDDIDKINKNFHTYIPQNCHLLLFLNTTSGLTHLNNGRSHLFEKPFSPNEISRVIKEITR